MFAFTKNAAIETHTFNIKLKSQVICGIAMLSEQYGAIVVRGDYQPGFDELYGLQGFFFKLLRVLVATLPQGHQAELQ